MCIVAHYPFKPKNALYLLLNLHLNSPKYNASSLIFENYFVVFYIVWAGLVVKASLYLSFSFTCSVGVSPSNRSTDTHWYT